VTRACDTTLESYTQCAKPQIIRPFAFHSAVVLTFISLEHKFTRSNISRIFCVKARSN
jgi:hypothetical protein